jgi:UDP-glucose 4-epimerase
MRVAAVGGAGFAGRHVVRRLLQSGCEVRTLDRREPDQTETNERILVADLLHAGDVVSAARVCAPVDAVVWLAASITQTTGVAPTAVEDVELMVTAPLRFLEQLDPAPQAFVYLSSIEVYGRPRRLPVDEDHPTNPFTSYGAAKLCAEQFLDIACKSRGIALSVLRPAFIYGPGQHPKNVIPLFLAAVRRGEPPTVYGTGNDIRDDVYVGDVAHAVERAVAKRVAGVFNVASGTPHRLIDVARAACDLGPPGLAPLLREVESSWVDRWYDIGRARSVLGCAPPTPFEQGLAEMWKAT